MANNCCPTEFIVGGTFVDVTLLRPDIMGGTLTGVTLKGGVTLDDATKIDLADQLCPALSSCIQAAVDGGSFTGITLQDSVLMLSKLINATLEGTVTLDAAAATSIATAICQDLRDCVIAHVENNAINGMNVTAAILTNTQLLGTLQLSADAANAIFTAIADKIKTQTDSAITAALTALTPEDIGAVNATNGTATNLTLNGGSANDLAINGSTFQNGTGSANTFTGSTFEGPNTFTGQMPLDTEALTHLCAQLSPCVNNLIDAATNVNLIAGVFQDCAGAPRAPGVRLPSCEDMNTAIELAIANLPAMDIISGFSYDETTHILTLKTTMEDGTTQEWQINLDSLGGQVVTDGITIGGTGTTADPIHAIVTETTTVKPVTTGDELPTNVHGARTALLGQPDKWIEFDGYILPAFNKP